MPAPVHSAAAENYLKHIYLLQEAEGRVSTSLLSEKLSVPPASATDMLNGVAGMLPGYKLGSRKYPGRFRTPQGMS